MMMRPGQTPEVHVCCKVNKSPPLPPKKKKQPKNSSAWIRHVWFVFMSSRLLETSAICLLHRMLFTSLLKTLPGTQFKKRHFINHTASSSDSPQFHWILPLSVHSRRSLAWAGLYVLSFECHLRLRMSVSGICLCTLKGPIRKTHVFSALFHIFVYPEYLPTS